MGLLRLYLAICVIGAHAGPVFPWTAHDGHQAVQIFFLISGFYMSMVYGDKYRSAREFYISRFLRIYPPYAIVFAMTVCASLLAHQLRWNWIWTALQPYFDSPFQHNGVTGFFFAAISNVTIFFQDWVMFLQHDAGTAASFTADFRQSHSPLYQYLVLPQAWSVGVELTFYLFVPLLAVLRSRTLVAIAAASLTARVLGYEFFRLDRDPWEYRFFPFELCTFILGMLSFRLYKALRLRPPVAPIAGRVGGFGLLPGCAALLLLFFCSAKAVGFLESWTGHHYAVLALYVGWAAALPALFHLFGRSKLDRFIGELSYPVYLSHLLVVSPMAAVVARAGLPRNWLGPLSAIAAVSLSTVLYVCLFAPLELRRGGLTRRLSAVLGARLPPSHHAAVQPDR